jgi:ribosomal protein S27E
MRCPESGKATGRWELPRRRVRCLVCGRLVYLLAWGEGIIVAPHHVPA